MRGRSPPAPDAHERARAEPPTAVANRDGDASEQETVAAGGHEAPTVAGHAEDAGPSTLVDAPGRTVPRTPATRTTRSTASASSGASGARTLADAVPPTTAELDPPPAARWIAVGALLAVGFVLLLVVLFSLWL